MYDFKYRRPDVARPEAPRLRGRGAPRARRLGSRAVRPRQRRERGAPDPRARRQRRRRVLPPQLRGSRRTSCDGGGPARGVPGRLGDALAPAQPGVPRVRADEHRGDRRVREADHVDVPRHARPQPPGGRLPGRLPADALRRRRDDRRLREGAAGAPRALRTGGRRDRRGGARQDPRPREPDHDRHGRHEPRRLADRRRAGEGRDGAAVRDPARVDPDDRHPHDRRRRREHRVGRRGRAPPGRAAERRRRSRAGLLREGRRQGDVHRRGAGSRLPGSGELPRRRDPARSGPDEGGDRRARATGWASRPTRPPPESCASRTRRSPARCA